MALSTAFSSLCQDLASVVANCGKAILSDDAAFADERRDLLEECGEEFRSKGREVDEITSPSTTSISDGRELSAGVATEPRALRNKRKQHGENNDSNNAATDEKKKKKARGGITRSDNSAQPQNDDDIVQFSSGGGGTMEFDKDNDENDRNNTTNDSSNGSGRDGGDGKLAIICFLLFCCMQTMYRV